MTKKEKHRISSSLWAKRNRLKCSKFLRDWRKKRIEWYISLKKGKNCKYCGESDIICLDFHHRDSTKKVSEIQRLVTSTANNIIVLTEIEKCDLICANCHRKIHREDYFSRK